MIQRLDQLSLQKFIELSCGDTSVLKEPDEEVNEKELADKAVELVNEYKTISTPGKAKIEMLDNEQEQKLLMKEKCTRILLALCLNGHVDFALEILPELDVDTSQLDTPDKIIKKCTALNNDAKYELELIAERKRDGAPAKVKDGNAVRKEWQGEIAWVMSVFRMSIDQNTINAAIYANLVQQAVHRMKQLSKMPRMLGNMY